MKPESFVQEVEPRLKQVTQQVGPRQSFGEEPQQDEVLLNEQTRRAFGGRRCGQAGETLHSLQVEHLVYIAAFSRKTSVMPEYDAIA